MNILSKVAFITIIYYYSFNGHDLSVAYVIINILVVSATVVTKGNKLGRKKYLCQVIFI